MAESVSLNSTNFDPDVDFLVSQWTLGYKKQADLAIDNLSPKSVYKAYLKMKEVIKLISAIFTFYLTFNS